MTGSFDCAGCGSRCGWPPDGAELPMCVGCRPRRDAVADPEGDIECCNCGARIWSGSMSRAGYCYCAHCAWGVKRAPEEQARFDARCPFDSDGHAFRWDAVRGQEECRCGAVRNTATDRAMQHDPRMERDPR